MSERGSVYLSPKSARLRSGSSAGHATPKVACNLLRADNQEAAVSCSSNLAGFKDDP
jgi:hypothetical protein